MYYFILHFFKMVYHINVLKLNIESDQKTAKKFSSFYSVAPPEKVKGVELSQWS